eukprot:scaffold21071_cov58-Phaeocystis_antarctica.AAC.6
MAKEEVSFGSMGSVLETTRGPYPIADMAGSMPPAMPPPPMPPPPMPPPLESSLLLCLESLTAACIPAVAARGRVIPLAASRGEPIASSIS